MQLQLMSRWTQAVHFLSTQFFFFLGGFYCVFVSLSLLSLARLARACHKFSGSLSFVSCCDRRQMIRMNFGGLKLTVVRKKKKKSAVVGGGEKGTVHSLSLWV